MSRATKTDRVVAKILGALRDEPGTEEAALNWIRSRYLPDQVFGFEDIARAISRSRARIQPPGPATVDELEKVISVMTGNVVDVAGPLASVRVKILSGQAEILIVRFPLNHSGAAPEGGP